MEYNGKEDGSQVIIAEKYASEDHKDMEAILAAKQISELLITEGSSYVPDSEVSREIDTMLIRLSEFLDVIDLIRSDTNLCLKTTLPLITEKAQQLNNICDCIDQLEMFVDLVEKTLETLESQTSEAESHYSTMKNIKKTFSGMFSKIGRRHKNPLSQHRQSSSSASQFNSDYQPVTVFSSAQLFGKCANEPAPDNCIQSNSTLNTRSESKAGGEKSQIDVGSADGETT